MEYKYTYDNNDRKSVLFRRDECISCGFNDTYITWQRWYNEFQKYGLFY